MDPIELDRLERVRRYAAVPAAARDDEWIREFEGAFWPSFIVAPPDHLVYGSRDRRPYRSASLPPFEREGALSGRESRPVRPAALVDELIDRGHGLLVGEPGQEPQCVMTLSEILSYRLYGRAFSRRLQAYGDLGTIPAGTTLQLAPPTEFTFPNWVRINVRRHLAETLGMERPRAVWVQFPDGRDGLAFDLGARCGIEVSKRQAAFEGLRWFLPARMLYFAVDALEAAPEMQAF